MRPSGRRGYWNSFDQIHVPLGGEFSEKLKYKFKCPTYARLKTPRAQTIENRAKMLKADWFKNDITRVN